MKDKAHDVEQRPEKVHGEGAQVDGTDGQHGRDDGNAQGEDDGDTEKGARQKGESQAGAQVG